MQIEIVMEVKAMTIQTQALPNTRSKFLTTVLRSDGVFAVLSGTVAVLGAGPVAGLIGLDVPLALVLLGVVLLGYGGLLLFYASKEPANVRIAQVAIVLNILWVLGSYLGLLLGWFPVNTAGKWTIALIAEVVFLFALLEIVALWRLRGGPRK
jgi:hypothetical protein